MIIMNLKKFLGIQSTQEKVEDYRKLKGQLANLETLGQELSDKFSIQKSVIDGVDGLPEEKKSEVFEKYRGFLKEHQKEVSSAVNERNKHTVTTPTLVTSVKVLMLLNRLKRLIVAVNCLNRCISTS